MKKIIQFVLCCPNCGRDDEIIEECEGSFTCDLCAWDFDYHEADYTLKELIQEEK